MISLTTDSPDTEATVGRLLQNQTDIGNAIKPFYGAAAGKQLTALLREHILIAADLIAAAKAGDQSGVAAEQARWTANADEIAAFLSSANPRFWKLGAMKEMMHAPPPPDDGRGRRAPAAQDWAADVQAYDRIHAPDPAHGRHALDRDRQAVPGAASRPDSHALRPRRLRSPGADASAPGKKSSAAALTRHGEPRRETRRGWRPSAVVIAGRAGHERGYRSQRG